MFAEKIFAVTYAAFNDTCMLYTGQVGQADPRLKLFRMASVSKLFTSVTVTQLAERGILNLDASIMDLNRVRFVQLLKRTETPERLKKWARIKIRHLLSHQAGISKDVPGALVFFNTESLADHSYPSMEDFEKGLTSVEFLYEPGQVPTGLKYSNLGMNMLARIVEDLNPQGLRFSEYVRRNVLSPLKMTATFYDVPLMFRPFMMKGFGNMLPDGSRTRVPLAFFTGSYDGSIGVATTADNLSKLGMEFLKVASGEGSVLKNRRFIADWLAIKSPASPGMGWANGPTWMTLPGETTKDPVWVGHTGTGSSERTLILTSPEKNLGVVVLFNVPDANREKYAKIISDFLPQKATPNSFALWNVQHAKTVMNRTPPPPTVTPAPYPNRDDLMKFVGVYFTDVNGYQEIKMSDDGYLLFFGQKLEVEDIAKGRFRFPPIPGPNGTLFNREPLVFEFDQNGRPVGIRVANVKKFKRIQ